MKLINKSILVTGSTSGVGLELVKQLCSANTVFAVGRSSEKLASLKSQHPQITALQCDLSDIESVRNLADEILSCQHIPDVILFNAAIQHSHWFGNKILTPEKIVEEINVNLTSTSLLIHLLLPMLTSSGKEVRLVFINSALAFAPKRSAAIYCATKSALMTLARSLNYQLDGTQIRVLQSYLPIIDTPMTEGRKCKKIPANQAAAEILKGINKDRSEYAFGKARILRLIHRIAPSLAFRITRLA